MQGVFNSDKTYFNEIKKEFEIILINKEESFKDIQKTNDFLMTDLSYHKKAYVKIKRFIF